MFKAMEQPPYIEGGQGLYSLEKEMTYRGHDRSLEITKSTTSVNEDCLLCITHKSSVSTIC